MLLYVLKTESLKTGNVVEKSLHTNETEIMLGPHNVLTENQIYNYTVTAVNSVGNITSKAGVINTCESQNILLCDCAYSKHSIHRPVINNHIMYIHVHVQKCMHALCD